LLLLALLLLLVGVAEAVRRLPGLDAERRRLQPAEEAAMEQAFEALGRRGLAADATCVCTNRMGGVCVCVCVCVCWGGELWVSYVRSIDQSIDRAPPGP
jgi:hypothetical protein